MENLINYIQSRITLTQNEIDLIKNIWFLKKFQIKLIIKKAFQGVTNLYVVAANFSMWAKNPKTEIYDNNIQRTQNVFDIAKECENSSRTISRT